MRILLSLCARLPLTWVHALGRAVGLLIYRFSASYRGQIHANLRRAGIFSPEMARAVALEQGAQAVEAPWIWTHTRDETLAYARCDEETDRVVEAAFASGKPLIFLTPHIGCYEVVPLFCAKRWLAPRDKDMAILYRVPRKEYLREIVENGREMPHVVPSSADLKGVRKILRTMKSGGVAGILPDQVPSQGDGIWAPLFGEDAYTMTFPMRLARQFDAKVLLCRVEREKKGWCLHIKVWEHELTGDDVADCTAMNQAIEQTILECPQQYLWSYNRYKCPKGVEKPKKA